MLTGQECYEKMGCTSTSQRCASGYKSNLALFKVESSRIVVDWCYPDRRYSKNEHIQGLHITSENALFALEASAARRNEKRCSEDLCKKARKLYETYPKSAAKKEHLIELARKRKSARSARSACAKRTTCVGRWERRWQQLQPGFEALRRHCLLWALLLFSIDKLYCNVKNLNKISMLALSSE